MVGHSFKLASRHLVRHKGYSSINVGGLALGMACCLMVLLFLDDELSYDRFHDRADRIYRVSEEVAVAGHPTRHGAVTPPPLAPALAEELGEVLEAGRLFPYFEGSLPGRAAVSHRNERQFYDRFFWADPSLLRIFTLPVVAGDPAAALTEPNTLVLSEATAAKYFGDDDPIGEVLRIDTGYSDEEYEVTAVVRDLPYNSHFHFDVLASFSSLDHLNDPRVRLDGWWLSDVYTYVLLAEGAGARRLEEKLPGFVAEHFPQIEGFSAWLHLQPLTDIHLRSHLLLELEINGDVRYVYIFSAVALVTLLIACVNFVNLSTARYADRARELGMRKVVGARRTQLVGQFLGESILTSALAIAFAVLLVEATLPAFNAFSGKEIVLRYDLATWAGLATLALVVGGLAGAYPALFLSSFRPIHVLKGPPVLGAGGRRLRKSLIVLQFAISVTLLIATGTVYDQLRFMRSQNLGFNLDDVIVLPVRDVELRHDFLAIKHDLAQVPNVEATTFSSLVVGREPPQIGIQVDGVERQSTIGTLIVDHEFLDVFDLDLVAGRNLAREEGQDQDATFLVNEEAVRNWGLSPQEAVGKAVSWGGWKKGRIVGVVRDFHHQPLRFPIEPLILHIRPIAMHYLYVRIAQQEVQGTVQALETTWRRIRPGKPFEHFFLDDAYDAAYRAEDRLGQLVGLFTLVAVAVACLGLLGLASFSVAQRTREIGIRKVVGSTVSGIVLLLSKEFVTLVVLANLLAWPVAYLLMRAWLEDFAFRTGLHLDNFLLAGLLALAIAWLTVSYHALTAALRDSAEALRYE